MLIRFVFSVLILISLTGCPRNIVEVDEVKPSIRTAPKTVDIEVANKTDAVHFDIGEVLKVLISSGALQITSNGNIVVNRGALEAVVQTGAIQIPLTLNIASGAVQAPITVNFNVPPKAAELTANLHIADQPGAVVVHGAEKGAIETRIEVPWWATLAAVIAVLATIFYVITKVRANALRSRSRARGEEKSVLDGPF